MSGRIYGSFGDAALLEMAREQGKSHEEAEEVGEDDPFVGHVRSEPSEARAGRKAREGKLVGQDRCKTAQRDSERVAMEERHPEKHHSEEDEVDGCSKHESRFSRGRLWRCKGRTRG